MKSGRLVAPAALAASITFVVASQPLDAGFERGHRGWVSAHTLAIAEKATLANGFVGYAMSLATERQTEPYYFDRYPPFFSAVLHAAQSSARPDKVRQIVIARQLMNVVHALTLLVAVLLFLELGIEPARAVAAVLLAAAGTTIVEYRDMVHYDQPGLLGLVVLLWAIARARRSDGVREALVASTFAAACGRSHASLVALLLWWLFDAIALLRRGPAAAALRGVATGRPARCLAVAVAAVASCLAWNVAMEARVRGVEWTRTSIVESATRRLALDRDFNEKKHARLDHERFLSAQRTNLARAVLPWQRADPLRGRDGARDLVAYVVAAVTLAHALTRKAGERSAWLVTVLAAPLWLLSMRNLTAFHPYVSLFLLPLGAVFFVALLQAVPTRWRTALPVAACALLVSCTWQRHQELERDAARLRAESADMQRIERALEAGDRIAADRRLFVGVPFALGFYLPRQDLVVEGTSALLVTRDAAYRGDNLTPENRSVFLYRTSRPYHSRLPLARALPDSRVPRLRDQRRAPGTQRRGQR